jgi:Leucine-rich repeat (LRR) protein
MKQILLICAVVALVGCGEEKAPTPQAKVPATPKAEVKKPKPTKDVPITIADPIVEKQARLALNKPEGEFTEADLEKILSLAPSALLTDAGLKEVAKLQKLTMLVLDHTQITDVGLKEVAKMQKLKKLSLDGTKITDVSLKDIAKLQKLTNLDLLGTKVTKAGVAELQKALPKCRIDSNPKK